MNIWYIKIRIKYNKTIVYVFGFIFVFLSGCRFHQTKPSEEEQNPVSQQNSIIIKDSVITKPDTLNNQPKLKKDSIPQKYNPRIDKQPLYGVKPNYKK